MEAVGFAGANEMRARKTREARSTIGDGGRISPGPGWVGFDVCTGEHMPRESWWCR
jgi:hypothetical protein